MEKKRICLMAAWGRCPTYAARLLTQAGYEVHCFGVVGQADEAALREICTMYRGVGMCQLGKIIRYMHRHGIQDVIALGKYHKSKLFSLRGIFRHLPDLTTARAFASHFITRKKDYKNDSLMMCMIRLFEKFGLRFGAPTDYAPKMLVPGGVLTRRVPTEAEWQDVCFGREVSRELGRFDVGQSVVVAGGTVMALEAMEGTDRCILRAGELYPKKGLVLVKMAKPEQDMRFDLPTIGMDTLETLHRVGGTVVAIEAGKTIIVEQPEVIRFADTHGISIVAIPEEAAENLS